jgi:uncharacterized protein
MIINFLQEFLQLTNEMSPYLLLGFLVAGILHVLIPKKAITKYLGKNNFKSVVYAALLGVPLPLCSCGVIPTGIAFKKEGASEGATVSFLISTPQTGVDSIMITYSLLGLPFAIIRPFVAFISGIFGGILTNIFSEEIKEKVTPKYSLNIDSPVCIDDCECKVEDSKKQSSLVNIFYYGFVEFMEDIAKWLIIGLLFATLISVLVPDDFFTSYISNPILSIFLVLALSIPLYICATGSVPIAAVLLMKGISPGAALVFLMAGPATNVATITVLIKSLGKKTAFIYVASITIAALFFGFFIDYFLPRSWFVIQSCHVHNHIHNEGSIFPLITTIILFILLINALFKKYRILWYSSKPKTMDTITLSVHGMTCNHCKANVEKNVSKIVGITFVEATPSKNEVIITGTNFSIEAVKSCIEEIGYQVK